MMAVDGADFTIGRSLSKFQWFLNRAVDLSIYQILIHHDFGGILKVDCCLVDL